MFYNSNQKPYDDARLQLKKMLDITNIKRCNIEKSKELIYYKDKNLSLHSIHLLNFYAELIHYGLQIKTFEREKHWLGGAIKSDGFIEYVVNDDMYPLCIEIDFTHKTDLNKYKRLYESNEIQCMYKQRYGNDIELFPKIIIISNLIPSNPIKCEDLKVIYLDFSLKDIISKVLL